MDLKLEYELITHPYLTNSEITNEQWAKIRIVIVEVNEVVKVVFDIQWDIIVLLQWFYEKKENLLNDEFPAEIKCNSIAREIHTFYETLQPDLIDEDLIEEVFMYRSNHGIRFSLRGVDVKDIYIGNKDGETTISFYESEIDNWNYVVNMREFFKQAEESYVLLNRDPSIKKT